MGWNQKGSRFYCEVSSQRARKEVLLGSRDSGIDITVAGEYGSLRIRVFARADDVRCTSGQNRGKVIKKRVDVFSIEFAPWRSCINAEAEGIPIAAGTLDFDEHKLDSTMVRLNEDVVEAYQILRAKEIMTED